MEPLETVLVSLESYDALKKDSHTLKEILVENKDLARKNEKLRHAVAKAQRAGTSTGYSLRFKILISLALAAYTALLVIVF